MAKGPLDQVFNLTTPMCFKSSPRRVPFTNDAPMPYGGMMLPGEQYDQQQNKPSAEMSPAHSNTTSCTSGGHVGDSMLVKTEAAGSSNCTELKDPYVPHGSGNSSILPATASAPPPMPQAQSIPGMVGQYSNPVFQGLLDPKAQYHKSLAEHSRMEQVQRKQLEEANKQQQLYIQLLQQYSNQLPESTRPQAEMLQTLLTDPNMVNMLQHIFKGQQQPPPEQPTTPPVVTSVSPVQQTPPLSAPPTYSPAPSSSSAMNQTVFQYHAMNGNKEYTQVSPETFTVEVSTMLM